MSETQQGEEGDRRALETLQREGGLPTGGIQEKGPQDVRGHPPVGVEGSYSPRGLRGQFFQRGDSVSSKHLSPGCQHRMSGPDSQEGCLPKRKAQHSIWKYVKECARREWASTGKGDTTLWGMTAQGVSRAFVWMGEEEVGCRSREERKAPYIAPGQARRRGERAMAEKPASLPTFGEGI